MGISCCRIMWVGHAARNAGYDYLYCINGVIATPKYIHMGRVQCSVSVIPFLTN